MNQQNPKKHHYVPECYLKEFCNKNNQLFKRKKDNLKTTACYPAQVCYDTDYFKFNLNEVSNLNDIKDAYIIERSAFKNQENQYRKLVKKIKEVDEQIDIRLSIDEYRLLLKTLLTIKRRNPSTRNQLLNNLIDTHKNEAIIQEYVNELKNQATKIGYQLSPNLIDRVKEYVLTKGQNEEYQKGLYLMGFVDHKNYFVFDNIIDDIISIKPFLLFAFDKNEFITSDNPGFFRFNDKTVSIGGLNGSFEFFFPITPEICLYLNSDYRERSLSAICSFKKIYLPEIEVRKININTKNIASLRIFGRDKMKLELI